MSIISDEEAAAIETQIESGGCTHPDDYERLIKWQRAKLSEAEDQLEDFDDCEICERPMERPEGWAAVVCGGCYNKLRKNLNQAQDDLACANRLLDQSAQLMRDKENRYSKMCQCSKCGGWPIYGNGMTVGNLVCAACYEKAQEKAAAFCVLESETVDGSLPAGNRYSLRQSLDDAIDAVRAQKETATPRDET